MPSFQCLIHNHHFYIKLISYTNDQLKKEVDEITNNPKSCFRRLVVLFQSTEAGPHNELSKELVFTPSVISSSEERESCQEPKIRQIEKIRNWIQTQQRPWKSKVYEKECINF